MARRQQGILDVLKVKAATPERLKGPTWLADGAGLYLQIGLSGAKSWLFRYTRQGKSHAMGLGPCHTVGLADARDAALQCRKQLKDGIDPIKAAAAKRRQGLLDAAKEMTFRQCAESYIEANKSGWKNEKHAEQWANTLKTYVYDVFGDFPVQEIDTALVLKVVQPIWTTKTETASRVRGRIEAVLDYAKVMKKRDGENPALWRGHLQNVLPAKSRVHQVVHHAALDWRVMGDFMVPLREMEGVAPRAVELQILTSTRPGEAAGARWDEFDLDEKVWTIPGQRMKGRRKGGDPHRVPLSADAMAVLKKMKGQDPTFVFPGWKPKTHLSDGACLAVLKRLGMGHLTNHGFRSSFRDWAAETTNFASEVVEKSLAHAIPVAVEAAYRRGELLIKRRRLMERWATYCATPSRRNNVIKLAVAQ